jgi:O-methyltransferase involved in polyketide biosynthesis
MVAARCELLDAAMLDAVEAGMQLILLAAGWDTRAYRLLHGRAVEVFEVDAPATQAVTRAAFDFVGREQLVSRSPRPGPS